MTVREGLSPFSGIICEIVQLVREILHLSGKSPGSSEKAVETMSNMFILLSLNTCC